MMEKICIDFEFREGNDREYALLCVSLYAPNVIDRQIWLDDTGKAELVQLMHDFKEYAFIAHYCYTPDMEVLTENGFKRWGEIDGSEVLAQYDINNGSIQYSRPNYLVKREYNGAIYEVESKHVSYSVTEGHDIVLKKKNGKKYKQPVQAAVPKGRSYINAGKHTGGVVNEPLIQLRVATQADGKILYNAKGMCNGIQFKFHKDRKASRLMGLLEQFGIKYTYYKRNYGDVLSHWIRVAKFEGIDRIAQKHWRDVMSFDLPTRVSLIEELSYWDGTGGGLLGKGGKINYTTKCAENANNIQICAIASGYRSNIRLQKSKGGHYIEKGRVMPPSSVYVVSLSTRTCTRADTIVQTTKHYSGLVYCANMPLGTLVVRRNGKVSIQGNCHAEVYSLLSLNDNSINSLLDDIRFIDTFMEARLLTNTDDKERTPKLGLANLVKKYKIYDYGDLKDDTRSLILGQTEYTEEEKQKILDYCRIDTVVNYKLYERLVSEHLKIFGIPVKLENQIIRSEYVKAQCLASYMGMPVDLDKLNTLRKNYYHIISYFFSQLSKEVQGLYEYKGLLPTFKYDKFSAKVKEWESQTHAKWELTEKGRYSAEGAYLKSISNSAKWVGELAKYQKKVRSLSSIKYDPAKMAMERLQQSEINYTLADIVDLQQKYKEIKTQLACSSKASLEALAKKGNKDALEAIIITEMCTHIRAKAKSNGEEEGVKKESLYEAIKTDGRIHQGYNVMKNLSFRNAPRSSSFIPAMSSWLRGLHYVPKGYKMVIIDIVSAEIILGALVAGDQDLLTASQYDFYQYSAYKMGLSSRDDVEVSKDEYEKRHGKLRTQVKTTSLAVNYGASKFSVSMSLFGDWKEQHLSEADRLIGLYKKGYQAYFRFNENCKRLRSSPTIYKDIGFRYIINPNSAGNFFIQGACARVLMHAVPRISCRKAIDRGIEFIYSLHDEVGLLVKDDENYTSNIAYITKSLQEAFMVAGLNNRHGLTINGKPYCADDVRVEVDEFNHGDIVYTKDRDTMKEILSLCEKIS